jgi:glycosyltransferase involved in cell wall biosynthesis
MQSVSIIIPARNEEETLPLVLGEVKTALDAMAGQSVEVIVVDDHSTDRTQEITRSFGYRVVENKRLGGKGNALRAGFEAAQGDILLMMDADFSHRAADIPVLLGGLRDPSVGLVIGSRVFGGSGEYTHVRALGNVFLSAMLGLCTGRYLSDALNGFKAFRREVFTEFEYTSRNFEIEIELIANCMRWNRRIVEVSSNERARAGGEMKSRVIRHGFRFLFRIWYEGLRRVKPKTRNEGEAKLANANVGASATGTLAATPGKVEA